MRGEPPLVRIFSDGHQRGSAALAQTVRARANVGRAEGRMTGRSPRRRTARYSAGTRRKRRVTSENSFVTGLGTLLTRRRPNGVLS